MLRSYYTIKNYNRCYSILSCIHNINDSSNDIINDRPKKTKSNHHQEYRLIEDELEEKFVRGHGPGGQATNKTNNMVQLKHKPTGIVIQCHETRSTLANKKIARKILKDKLDYMANGDDSKIGRKIAKIKKRKYNAQRRANKKYRGEKDDSHSDTNENDSDSDSDSDSDEDKDNDDSKSQRKD
jgi:protein subunit release factor A